VRDRAFLRLLLVLTSVLILAGCGTKDRVLDTDALSDLLSISNLSKLPIRSSADPSLIVGLAIDVDIINVGNERIDEPFTVTWRLRDAEGNTLGQTATRLAAGLSPGQRRSVTLNITFSPVPDLEGVQDVVTFDLID
jgi:hypothetical protein